MEKLYGTGVALVTPFNNDNSIDFDGLKRLLEHTATGVDYFVVQGTTGESATTTHDEKQAILKFVIENNPKQLPIVYGIGGNNTSAVIDSIKNSHLAGVDAILSVSPCYNKPSQEGIYQHYITLAEASPAPIILYNVPGRTMSNLTAKTTLKLANHKNIIGVKEASGDLQQAMKISRNKPKDFMLISGDDLLTGPLYSIGAVGVISVLANAFPKHFEVIKDGAFSSDFKKTNKALFDLLEINPLMYTESNPVGIKQALKHLKVCDNFVRLPLLNASDNLQKLIEETMARMQAFN